LTPLKNGELLGMVGKGTPGGQPRADGSEIERGVHLRWQMAQELGFPPGGFDIYRRGENYGQFLRCGNFREADVVGVAWSPYSDNHSHPSFSFQFSGDVRHVRGCERVEATAAAFPGVQDVRLNFEQTARTVRIMFDTRTEPGVVAEAYWQTSTGDVLMARE
jgi:hypothetical protein